MRQYTARRLPTMGDWPTWAVATASAALSGLGVMVAGWFRASADNRKIRADDRADFLQTVIARLSQVEQSAVEERRFCEERLAQQAAAFEARLKSRDEIILALQDRVAHLEKLTDSGEKHNDV